MSLTRRVIYTTIPECMRILESDILHDLQHGRDVHIQFVRRAGAKEYWHIRRPYLKAPQDANKYWRDGKRTPEYLASLRRQLGLWIAGVWEHNKFSNECTPDFGCCVPAMRDSEADRQLVGNKKLRELAKE